MDNNPDVEGHGPSSARSSRDGRDAVVLPSRLDAIYRDHAAFVWRVLRRYGFDGPTAEDLMHEVFLVVHRRIADYDGRASMTSWLYGIARGVAANHRRGRAREERRLELVGRPDAGRDLPDPEMHVEAREAADLVAGFLAGLDEDKRVAFELSELEGLTGPEIASLLRVKVDTVYSRVRVARQRFNTLVERMRPRRGQ